MSEAAEEPVTIRIGPIDMRAYLDWLKDPMGVWFQMEFATADGMVRLQLPLMRNSDE